MKRYFIDTNIFLRTIVVENEKMLRECKGFLLKVKKGDLKAVTSRVVIAEVVWVLKSYYKLTRSQISEAIYNITNLKGLKIIDGGEIKLATKLYENSKVKYIDALISSIKEVQKRKWIIVSYDKDFDKLKVKRVEPGKV